MDNKLVRVSTMSQYQIIPVNLCQQNLTLFEVDQSNLVAAIDLHDCIEENFNAVKNKLMPANLLIKFANVDNVGDDLNQRMATSFDQKIVYQGLS